MIQYPPWVVVGIVSVVLAGMPYDTVVVKVPDAPTQEMLLLDVLRQ
jgi:hypothetical protein